MRTNLLEFRHSNVTTLAASGKPTAAKTTAVTSRAITPA
jgi:hypothetical protein